MSGAKFVEVIRKQVLKVLKDEFLGLELATVISPYPNLIIKIDNMKVELHKEDLIVCEKLARNVRVVSIKSNPGSVRNLGDSQKNDSNTISGNPLELNCVQLRFEEVLKAGDRVLVQAIPGGQKYIIFDRVIEYG